MAKTEKKQPDNQEKQRRKTTKCTVRFNSLAKKEGYDPKSGKTDS